MSGIGIISQEYKNTAILFKTLNNSIILLKKHYYKLNSAEQISAQELSTAREKLADILDKVVAQLNDNNSLEENEQYLPQIPPFFIKRLQEQHKGDINWYKDDLKEVQQILSDGQELTSDFINRIDELCEQLDAETTRLYRKLRRR
jgi:thioester reductase-like protein